MKTKEVAWDEELASWQKSGLSQAEYCRRRNVSPKGFAYRLMKSRAEPSTHRRSYQSSGNGSKCMRRLGKRNAGFIEITREGPQRSEYSIRTKGGRELVIRGSIEVHELRTLLEVLESC